MRTCSHMRATAHSMGVHKATRRVVRNGDLDVDARRTHLDDVAFAQLAIFEHAGVHLLRQLIGRTTSDALAVDVGAVETSQIAHPNGRRVDLEYAMMPRHVCVQQVRRQRDVTVRRPAHRANGRLVKNVLSLLMFAEENGQFYFTVHCSLPGAMKAGASSPVRERLLLSRAELETAAVAERDAPPIRR